MTESRVQQLRSLYAERMTALRAEFEGKHQLPASGVVAVRDRAQVVDEIVSSLWADQPDLVEGISIVAIGGYGRRELFPFSDIDLMFLLDARISERIANQAIRSLSQSLWDVGLRVSPMTRTLAECSRFDPDNVEFTLALLDARHLVGDPIPAARLIDTAIPKLIARDRKRIVSRLLDVTRVRYAKYDNTLFHLEPNVKECPGGLRDVHVCAWLGRLAEVPQSEPTPEFLEAWKFLTVVRAFVHFRHGRNDNTLDWEAQDAAAVVSLGISDAGLDASYWMRVYFRYARAILRRAAQVKEDALPAVTGGRLSFSKIDRSTPPLAHPSIELHQGRIYFTHTQALPEHDPDTVLAIFTAISKTGASLPQDTEIRLQNALPRLSANLEDGGVLWRHLQSILTGVFAGSALRAMHALGILELVLPEFHGIDALVIRDAYHRYTVDEHTFVLIDTLHALPAHAASKSSSTVWPSRYASILRDLPHPELLYLAALLHDTGKGHFGPVHALESVRLAASVLARLELAPYEGNLVLDLIRNHLEMSAALRRDIFDTETIRVFASQVSTPETLRMLTLLTYADISAVHPGALTPWKAESLWHLYLSTSSFLDRQVDDERITPARDNGVSEVMLQVYARLRDRRRDLAKFLEGLPVRYLQTRSVDQICTHFEMASRLDAASESDFSSEFDLRYAPGLSEVTLITKDRPMLFGSMAGVLAAWRMNIVTAEAFSNAHGVVVDSFRFTDTYHTLELNASERARFVNSMRESIAEVSDPKGLLETRRSTRKNLRKVRVETRVNFDNQASARSTLLQVVSQDSPGLLHTIAVNIAAEGCEIEVALIDTEGDMAIDVFYLRRYSAKLDPGVERSLGLRILEAIRTVVC